MISILASLQQAITSSAICVALALVLAPLFGSTLFCARLSRPLLLLPQFVSPLITVLGLFLAAPNLRVGFWPMVLGHVFLNLGLCIVILGDKYKAIQVRWRGLKEFYGVKNYYFLQKITLPLILPSALKVFALVVLFCLGSLYIPLSLGGGAGSKTLEVAIFEAIKVQGSVQGAVLLALLQIGVQLLVLFYLKEIKNRQLAKKTDSRIQRGVNLPTGPNPYRAFFEVLFCVFLALYAYPFFAVFKEALLNLNILVQLFKTPSFLNALAISLTVATGVGLIVLLTVVLISMSSLVGRFDSIPQINGPVIGLILYIVLLDFQRWDAGVILALILGQSFIFLIPTVRSVVDTLHENYFRVRSILSLWPVKPVLVFKKIYWPMNKRLYLFSFLLPFLWSLGDYALSAVLVPEPITIPLFMQSLLGQYRFDFAAAAGLVLIGLGTIGAFVTSVGHYGEN